jgi:hypothetical protein
MGGLASKKDRLRRCIDRNLHFGTRLQTDLVATVVGQSVLNTDRLVLVIRAFNRDLCLVRFARKRGSHDFFDHPLQGDTRFLRHGLPLYGKSF